MTTPPAASAPPIYIPEITPDTRVATILHTSPFTGIGGGRGLPSPPRSGASRPDCIIIVDGIQPRPTGGSTFDSYDVDGYVGPRPYKVFSRHGYGVAWVSDRTARDQATST